MNMLEKKGPKTSCGTPEGTTRDNERTPEAKT